MEFLEIDGDDKEIQEVVMEANGEDGSDEETRDWSKIGDAMKNGKGGKRKKLNKSGVKNGNSGDKQFEPLNNVLYDTSNLELARSVMLETLSTKRGIHSPLNQVNQTTVFYNSFLNKCYMYSPRGTFLKSMGQMDKSKRLWLEFEEAIYLVERGSCIAKDDSGVIVSEDNFEIDELHKGVEMSLEELYSLLIKNDEDYNHYCVYANLKRLGYIIMRTDHQPISDQNNEINLPQNISLMSFEDYSSLRQRISQNLSMLLITNFTNLIFRPLVPVFHVIKNFLQSHQIISSSILHHSHFSHTFYKSYTAIFGKLGFVPSAQNVPADHASHVLLQRQKSAEYSSNFELTYNVWKPTPTFSKKNPPLPDYQICITNIHKTNFPTLHEINDLMNASNHRSNRFKNSAPSSNRKFANLQDGYRNFIIAVVDHGVINYINFKELDFNAEGVVYKDFEPKKPRKNPKEKSSSWLSPLSI